MHCPMQVRNKRQRQQQGAGRSGAAAATAAAAGQVPAAGEGGVSGKRDESLSKAFHLYDVVRSSEEEPSTSGRPAQQAQRRPSRAGAKGQQAAGVQVGRSKEEQAILRNYMPMVR